MITAESFLKEKMYGEWEGGEEEKWDFQESFAHILFGNFLCLIIWKKKKKKKGALSGAE